MRHLSGEKDRAVNESLQDYNVIEYAIYYILDSTMNVPVGCPGGQTC